MNTKRMSSHQSGLSLLILIPFVVWALHFFFAVQEDRGPLLRENEIFILITGNVRYPGVYLFTRAPTLKELIGKAGGLEQGLIGDEWDEYSSLGGGTSIHIGSAKEYVEVSSGSFPAHYKVTLGISISLNTASQEELEAIPHIGPSLARKIIHHRTLYGPFTTTEKIKSVPGVGEVRFEKIRPYIEI